jgi:outer membrane murein-binding lipoprotein Lpp
VKQINDLKQNVKKQEDNLKHNEDVKIKLNKVKEYLVANLTDTKTVYGQDMHAKLKELNVDTSNSDCIHKILELVKQKLDQYLSQTSSLELKIKENQDLHEKKLQEELDRKNKEFKMYLDNNQSDLNDKHVNEIDVIRKEHSKFVSLIQNDYTQKVDQLNLEAAKSLCKIDELSTEINQMRNDLASAQELSSKYSIVNERKEQFEAELNQLRLDLEVSRSQENKLQTDIDLYRSKLNELNSIDENYQKNLNEATQNYK